MLKRLVHLAIVFFLVFHYTGVIRAQNKITTVVIDAGHGGKDPGAMGKHSREKDITLKVALKTGHYIEKYLKDVKVIYTRKTDRFVELKKRTKIANDNKADVFISIHCNSSRSSAPYGAETYTMGLHKDKANLDVAMMENAAILLEDNAKDEYGGFNPNAPESYIELSLLKDENLDQSLELASLVQKQFKDRVGRKDRGVNQAGFLVLWRATMPSILIELGFLSNPTEERFLNSEEGQAYMASAIYRAFKEFKIAYEKENVVQGEEKTEHIAKTQPKSGLNYRIQFYTNPRSVPLTDKRFRALDDVSSYYHNGLYKYTSGHYKTLAEAERHLKKVRNKGYGDAFIVPFSGDKRISPAEAREMEH
jgi:N-acetylmuramoyl-L-alanine amidase